MRDLKLKIMLRELHACGYKECFCQSFKLKACQTFIDFWDDNVVIPSIRIFHIHPSFKEKLLMVIWLMSNDFNIVKVHMMMILVDMAHNFGIFIEHQNSLFVLRHLHLQWSFCLAIVHKIALSAIDFVHYSRRWTVDFILLLRLWKSAFDFFSRLYKTWICCCFNNLPIIFQTHPEHTKAFQNIRCGFGWFGDPQRFFTVIDKRGCHWVIVSSEYCFHSWVSSRFPLFVEGMFLSLRSNVLTADRLWPEGWWEWKSRYIAVCMSWCRGKVQ